MMRFQCPYVFFDGFTNADKYNKDGFVHYLFQGPQVKNLQIIMYFLRHFIWGSQFAKVPLFQYIVKGKSKDINH